jgi:hypothetical protein
LCMLYAASGEELNTKLIKGKHLVRISTIITSDTASFTIGQLKLFEKNDS